MTIDYNLQPELLFLKILLNKEAYDKYNGYIDRGYIKETYRELSFLYTTLDELHRQKSEDISLAEFSAAFAARYPDADRNVYGGLFQTLSDADISEEIGKQVLGRIKERRDALTISESAFRVAQGLEERSSLEQLVRSFGEEGSDNLGLLKPVNFYEALDNAYKEQGIRWRLDCLNKSLGSLRSGDFGFIFARPETGKTTFLASEVTLALSQQAKVCWFNNEEDGNKVAVRIIQAYFGITLDVYTAKKREFNDRFREDVGDKIQLFDEGQLNKKDIEAITKEYSPDLVIYDQIDKIRGFQNDRDDLRLGAIYQWARELAKGSHAAIGVCQADGHAEGVRYLTMEHVANAKTSKQAEADFIIGIGCQHLDGQEFIRYLNISKNKLFGDEDSLPEFRHGRFEVLIEPQIARYRDIIKFE